MVGLAHRYPYSVRRTNRAQRQEDYLYDVRGTARAFFIKFLKGNYTLVYSMVNLMVGKDDDQTLVILELTSHLSPKKKPRLCFRCKRTKEKADLLT